MAVTAATLMGVASASTPGHPADVAFIAMSVPHAVLSNVTVAAGATTSVAVIGGKTTVPSDASSVRIKVVAKSAAAASLTIFPADHLTSTTTDSLAFAGGNVAATKVTKQNPGLNGRVSFRNNGTSSAVVSVTLTGYSTQTTASNVSGAGGTAGQVLTNDGAGGASWQPAASTYAIASSDGISTPLSTATYTPVASVSVPAGYYVAVFSGSFFNSSAQASLNCRLGNFAVGSTGVVFNGSASLTVQALISIGAGGLTLTVGCEGAIGMSASVQYRSLILTRVATAAGSVYTP